MTSKVRTSRRKYTLHHYVDVVVSDILVLKLISVLVFILFSFFIVGEILQPSGGHVQGKGILIAGMAPDLSYDNTRNERLNFSGMK